MKTWKILTTVLITGIFIAHVADILAEEPYVQSKAAAIMKAAKDCMVQVNIIKPCLAHGRGKDRTRNIIVNGKHISNYRPQIVELYPTTGVVLDKKGNILVYLGERWLDLKDQNSKLEVSNPGDNKRFGAKVIGIDQRTGFAVINSPVHLNPAKLQLLTRLKQGESVCTIDFHASPPFVKIGSIEDIVFQPYGSIRSEAMRRDFWDGPTQSAVVVNFPGRNSFLYRKPVLDLDGNVIGISANQLPGYRTYAYGGNQVAVVPFSQALPIARRIINTGTDIPSGWLGVQLDDLSPELKRELNINQGAVVTRIIHGGPAEEAGILEKDVIVRYEGTDVVNMRQLVDLVKRSPIGKKVSIVVVRNKQPHTLQAVIEKRKEMNVVYIDVPEDLEINIPEIKIPDLSIPTIEIPSINIPQRDLKIEIPAFDVISRRYSLGVTTNDLTPQLGEYFGVKDGKGVLVTSIEKESPAEKAGIKAGDVLVKVDDLAVDNRLKFLREVRKKNPGERVKVNLIRDKKPAEYYLTVEGRSRIIRGATKTN